MERDSWWYLGGPLCKDGRGPCLAHYWIPVLECRWYSLYVCWQEMYIFSPIKHIIIYKSLKRDVSVIAGRMTFYSMQVQVGCVSMSVDMVPTVDGNILSLVGEMSCGAVLCKSTHSFTWVSSFEILKDFKLTFIMPIKLGMGQWMHFPECLKAVVTHTTECGYPECDQLLRKLCGSLGSLWCCFSGWMCKCSCFLSYVLLFMNLHFAAYFL